MFLFCLQGSDCKKPCRSLSFTTSSQIVHGPAWKNNSYLFLYFDNSVIKSEEKRLYLARNLFAEIGGYLGMFLGYSLLQLSDSVTRVFHKTMKALRKLRNPRNVSCQPGTYPLQTLKVQAQVDRKPFRRQSTLV